MQYLLLIYGPEDVWATMSEAEAGAVMDEYRAFTESIQAQGIMQSGAPLAATSTARTVRVRDGRATVSDGPFAETREQLGGFYLVEAKDLDEATKIAARIPSAKIGSIEVRPIMVFDS
jgi:hypothetical protein